MKIVVKKSANSNITISLPDDFWGLNKMTGKITNKYIIKNKIVKQIKKTMKISHVKPSPDVVLSITNKNKYPNQIG